MDNTGKNRQKKRPSLVGFILASVVLMVLIMAVALNFEMLKDIVMGMRYRPSAEMETIRESLELTDTGRRIFNAAMPELKTREEFNHNCREQENETAILGCYRDERIYVYNITDAELNGIRELTAAHELLHAVYKRMSSGDKNKWADLLAQVYTENQETLERELEIYADEQKQEELYVRAGTEIRDLPVELEAHYAEIFKNQDKVTEFYNSYIAVFRKVEKKLDELLEKAEKLTAEINTKSADYESRASTLSVQVDEFNACAAEPDCFSSGAEFSTRRTALTTEQAALSSLYTEINQLIAEYNQVVSEYNENVLHGQELNMKINSLQD